MSSACVCHTDEWCFYCNMYLPLEQKRETMKWDVCEFIKLLREKERDAVSLSQNRTIGMRAAFKYAAEKLEEVSDTW